MNDRIKLQLLYYLGEATYEEAFPKETVMFRGLEIELDPVVSKRVFDNLVDIATACFKVPDKFRNDDIPSEIYD